MLAFTYTANEAKDKEVVSKCWHRTFVRKTFLYRSYRSRMKRYQNLYRIHQNIKYLPTFAGF